MRRGQLAEQVPGEAAEAVGLAVAAGEQVLQLGGGEPATGVAVMVRALCSFASQATRAP